MQGLVACAQPVGKAEHGRQLVKRREIQVAALRPHSDERFAEISPLRLPYGVVAAVADHEHAYRKPVRRDRLQLLQVHHQAAFSVDHGDGDFLHDAVVRRNCFFPVCRRKSDRGREPVPHGSRRGIREESPSLPDAEGLGAGDPGRPDAYKQWQSLGDQF